MDERLPSGTAALADGAGPIGARVVAGLAKIGLATRHQAWEEASERRLTPTQGQILALLRRWSENEGAARLSDVADQLALTAPTVSVAVRALAAKGLVEKGRATADGRALAIRLTDAGRREADHAASWADFLLEAIDGLTPAEQEVFLRALVKIVRTLQGRGRIPVSRMCVTCRFFRPNVYADPALPHHCAFVDAPFGDRHLRLDCGEHQAAEPEQAEWAWEAFATTRNGIH